MRSSQFCEKLVLLGKESFDKNFTYIMESHNVLDVEGVLQLFCGFLKSVLFLPLKARQEFENEDGNDWYFQPFLFFQVRSDIFQVSLFQTTWNHLFNDR
jgi:hypothetical protein